ncbi:MAG: hypothetical protein P0Y62_04175 [Candidatus Chryseobacterium colombiense]|nr:hypothetical protein [Chryseobacterium sp.]WEK70755.1 MAG: hypothetical protein P0Y62_04175 [Chryseobacterium sp.]
MSENEKKENPQLPKNEEENLTALSQKGGTRGGKNPINEASKSGTTGG